MTNKNRKFYIPLPKNENAPTGYIEFFRDFQFVEVNEEVYLTFHRPIWKTWKEAKSKGCCSGDDWKRCLGDCATCSRYHRGSDILSLDVPVDSEECSTLADTIVDPTSLVDSVLAESAALEELLAALADLDPDGRRIGELLLEGKSGREISRVLGIAHTTYLRRFSKLQDGLKKRLEKIF